MLGRLPIASREDPVQCFGAQPVEFGLPTLTYTRIGTGKPEIVDERTHIQCRPAGNNGQYSAPVAIVNRRTPQILKLGDAQCAVGRHRIDEMMTNLPAQSEGDPSGADIQAPVDLISLGSDDLAAHTPAHLER